eukprot:scaffold103199_cov21-Tisochrysis_lutea.AAC.1
MLKSQGAGPGQSCRGSNEHGQGCGGERDGLAAEGPWKRAHQPEEKASCCKASCRSGPLIAMHKCPGGACLRCARAPSRCTGKCAVHSTGSSVFSLCMFPGDP